jgi:hypothetical protein
VTGNATISTNLIVSGTAAVTSSLTANGITISSGGLTVNAGQTINFDTNAPTMYGSNITAGTIPIASVVGTAMNLDAAQTVTGAKTFTGGITATGAQTITFGTNAPTMYGNNIANNTINQSAIIGGVGSNNISNGLNVTGTYLSTGYCGNFAGNIVATSYNATSDRRLKTNVAPLSSQWTTINKIEPVTFNWIADGRPDIGFIAQNVYNTYPQLRPNYAAMNPTSNIDEPVDLSGNPLYYAIDYGRMTPFLWQGMREVMRRIETLESENAELKTRIRTIESALA